MKKIVPFKKNIDLETSVSEINSISLEHTLKLKEENLVSGEFIVSGTYKMTEASLNVDTFEYKLPFDISIDKKYDTKNIEVDINDFYYEVISGKTLSIDIEVSLDNLEEKPKKEERMTEEVLEVETEKQPKEEKREENTQVNQMLEEAMPVNQTVEETIDNTVKSIFENLDDNERYAVYKVHILKENDTTESIIQDYEITREDLEAYNDLNDLKVGDKLIIPSHEN